MMGSKSINISNSGSGAVNLQGAAIGDRSTSNYSETNITNSGSAQTQDKVLLSLYSIREKMEAVEDLPAHKQKDLNYHLTNALEAYQAPKPDRDRVRDCLKSMKVITDGIAAMASAVSIGELIASTIALFG